MAKLVWDQAGERLFETGVKNGVLYVQGEDGNYLNGVVWNGLTAVTESPSGAEETPLYADDIKYVVFYSNEEFKATIEAYTYPEEFEQCDGSAELGTGVKVGQQARRSFGLVYKTSLGNDIQGQDFGYKIHIIYGAKAAPSEKAYATVNDSPEAITFSWELSTVPVNVNGFKPTSIVTIDSTKCNQSVLKQIEDRLFGTNDNDAELLMPDDIKALLGE